MTRILVTGLALGMFLSIAASAQLPKIVPRTGLVAYHDFNGTFENRIAGKHRFKNNGVVFETQTINGREVVSARFDGQPREAVYLEAEDPSTFRTNTYTYAVRFKVDEFRPLNTGGFNYYHQALLAFCPPSWKWGAAYSLVLNQLDNSVLNAGQWTPSRPYFASTPYRTTWLDKWYTAAVTYDGTTMKLYFEGKLVDERTAALDYSNQTAFIIGGAKDGPDGKVMGGFNGNIDDFAFWNRPLSSEEISRVHRGLQQSSYDCRQLLSVETISIDAREESTDSVMLKDGAIYQISGYGTWSPNGGYSKADCEWEYFEPCNVRGPSGGLYMGFDLDKTEQNQETLQPIESSIECNTHYYKYVVRGTGKPLYILFRDQPLTDNSGGLVLV
ncbi:MAG: LamG domain-containing protein, partial [Candidatus Kapabacteria bacterium]|nr:LamG domain-containing protein [Candidatus Kapabacteria bacterium]